jgi:uncharacterized membrane protein YdjX (TVP38/TMEM64 family)
MAKPRSPQSTWLKLLPVALLLCALFAFFYFRLYTYFSWETLQNHRTSLIQQTRLHPFLAVLSFCLLYTVIVAISVPYASFLTLLGGFLFGPLLGTLYVVSSATLGACIVFWAAKTAFRTYFERKAQTVLKKIEKNFHENTVSYLLFLRLVPLFPFWLINLSPALIGIRLKTFAITTFIGILPGTFVYVLLGNGLGAILDQGSQPNLDIIFKPVILIPIIALGLLALLPIIYRKIKRS